jgi:hypothetical protein
MTKAAHRHLYVPALLALCCAAAGIPHVSAGDPTSIIPKGIPPFLTPPQFTPPNLPGLPSLTTRESGGLYTEEDFVFLGTALDALSPGDQERHKLSHKTEGEWGALTSQVVCRAPEPPKSVPYERGEWSTEDTLQVPVTGPFALYGQAVLAGEYAADQDMKVIGRTGVIWKMPVWGETPLEVRGGGTLKYSDALRLEKTRDQASFLLELKAKMLVTGNIGLEYNGSALPALTPVDKPAITHDLGLAIPVSGGKVKLGAKQRWEALQQDTRLWNTNMELYVGVEIGR